MIRKFLPQPLAAINTLTELRQVRATISTPNPDRTGDIVLQRGIRTAPFLATGGTVLWSHDPENPIAKCIKIGIGTTGNLEALVQFPPTGTDPLSDRIYGLILAGVVCSTSIGFSPDPDCAKPLDPSRRNGPMKYEAVELCEFSFVSVPANVGATVIDKSARTRAGRVLNEENHATLVQAHALIGDILVSAESGETAPVDSKPAGKSYTHRQREAEVLRLAVGPSPMSPSWHSRQRQAEALRLVFPPRR